MNAPAGTGPGATVDLAEADTADRSSDTGLVTSRGETIIREAVVARIAGRAAAEVDGVGGVADTGLGGFLPRSSNTSTARASAAVDNGEVRLDLTLNVVYPRSVNEVTGEVRAHVTRRVAELCGMTTRRVDITVLELVTPPRPSRPRVL